ncbi:MAG: sulfate permease [Crocinitomicaceae bacterium]|nr:sulfate permease [Crocinitomicaceae bacterium]MBK9591068.1 sulfate permease [Crocinitomicaceae bacterium]
MARIESIIPSVSWVKNYKKSQFKGDLAAGLTVGVMLIPQGMAYSMIAGLPPVYGLYAALVPILIYALLGTSRQLSVGPVAMDSLFVAATVSVMAIPGSPHYIELAIALALMMGAAQLLFGLIRLGFLVNFLSKPVIVGFTSAAALVILFNQFGNLLGINLIQTNQLHILLADFYEKISSVHFFTLIFAIAGISFIMILKRIQKKIPAGLVLVFLGTLITYFFHLDQSGIQIVKEVPAGFPEAAVPNFSWLEFKALLPSAIALALIAFMEAYTVSKTIEEKKGVQEVDANKELIALGSANVVGSFFSAFPVTGGFSRTAVNNEAGAKTPLAGLIAAVVILLALLFLTDLFYYLPKVSLAVLILVAVIGLIDLKSPRHWWRTDTLEFLMYAVTLLATLFIGIQQGIFIGVILSLIVLVYKVSNPHMAIVGKIPGTDLYRNVERFSNVELDPEVLIVRFDAGLFYANADYFKDKLFEFEKTKHGKLKAIIVDSSGINSIDSTSIYMIRKLLLHYKRKKVKLLFSGLIGPVRDKFNQNRIYTDLGEEFFFVNIAEAERYLKGEPLEFGGDVSRQSNFKLRERR